MPASHSEFAATKVIVMSAPNGARRGKADHPALPVTATEIAATASSLVTVGVSVLHLHVRATDGGHTLDVDRYREAISAVREAVGDRLVIQVTSEAVGKYGRRQQMEMVRALRPEAVSLALRELCPDAAAEPEAGAFFESLGGLGCWPQYILYCEDDVTRFDRLRRKGFFGEDAPFCLFVLGRYADSLTGEVDELKAMLAAADTGTFPWAVCCFGRHELDAALLATAQGGHVRLGFENNLQLADGSFAEDNAAIVRQYATAIAGSGRRPASADEVRGQFFHEHR